VLQCVAVCCSVLQCVAVCCSVLQCVAVCCSVLQCVAVCCSAVSVRRAFDILINLYARVYVHEFMCVCVCVWRDVCVHDVRALERHGSDMLIYINIFMHMCIYTHVHKYL